MKNNKPCKFAVNPSGDIWECSVYRTTRCNMQVFDINAYDNKINMVKCAERREDTPVAESGSKKRQRKATPDVSANADTD